MQISLLCGNLIVMFSDYVTGSPFLSLIGDTRIDDTAKQLLAFSAATGLGSELKLVPKTVADLLNQDHFVIEEDRDNFDYIFSMTKLADYKGNSLMRQRSDCNRFMRVVPSFRVESISLSDEAMKNAAYALFERWSEQKGKAADSDHERVAFRRCIESAANLDLVAVGLFVDSRLVAFSVVGLLQAGFCIGHFEKAESTKYPGIYAFLRKQVALTMLSLGIKYMNFEQDLGIAGLRENKKSYAPILMLRKFRVRLR